MAVLVKMFWTMRRAFEKQAWRPTIYLQVCAWVPAALARHGLATDQASSVNLQKE